VPLALALASALAHPVAGSCHCSTRHLRCADWEQNPYNSVRILDVSFVPVQLEVVAVEDKALGASLVVAAVAVVEAVLPVLPLLLDVKAAEVVEGEAHWAPHLSCTPTTPEHHLAVDDLPMPLLLYWHVMM